MKHHFFDIGANIGQTFSDYLIKTQRFDGWDVWCFEPSPRHLQQLMCECHHWAARYKIHICPFGIRDDSGTLTFHEKDDPRGDSFEKYLASDHETLNLTTGYELRCFAAGIIDTIRAFTDQGDRIILKLDCEGSEFSILEKLRKDSLALSQVDEIHVEFHHISKEGSTAERDALIRAYQAKGVELRQWMY